MLVRKILSGLIISVIIIYVPGCAKNDENLPPLLREKTEFRKPTPTKSVEDSLRKEEQIKNLAAKVTPYFIENRGQISNQSVKFYLQVSGKTVFLTDTGMVMDIYRHKEKEENEDQNINRSPFQKDNQPKEKEGVVIRIDYVGAKPSGITGEQALEGKVNYFIGDRSKWKKGIATYQEVLYRDLYPKINMRVTSMPGQLKYQFEVDTGGNPKDIVLKVSGADGLEMNGQGFLVMHTAFGDIVDDKPSVYQFIDGEKHLIDAEYKLLDEFTYGFVVGQYDKGYPCVIDPALAL